VADAQKTFPRWWLASLSGAMAVVFGWSAAMLPWRAWTTFAVATAIVGAVHGVVAVLGLVGHAWRKPAWRWLAAITLGYLGYLTWNFVISVSYITALYGRLGQGVAVALGLVWLIVVALVVPYAAWAISATGGVPRPSVTRSGGAALMVLFGVGIMHTRNAAAAVPTPVGEADPLAVRLRESLSGPRKARPGDAPSLMIASPVRCEVTPNPGLVSIVATFLADDHAGAARATSACLQAPTLEGALAALADLSASRFYAGPVKIDVIRGVRALHDVVPVVNSMALRPGLDGVCEGADCLMPWQLLALDMFRRHTPIPVIPDLTFGVDAVFLRRALEHPWWDARGPFVSLEGLTRIETHSFVMTEGDLVPLRRIRPPAPEFNPVNVERARSSAEDYIARAIGADGRFEYKMDPFTGHVSNGGFSLPRQAGTTLVMCELASDRDRARKVVDAALDMIATTEHTHGDLSGLHYPGNRGASTLRLGDTALATIAFLSCRDLVGDRFDPLIARLGRFLLAMQKPGGSFYPSFDVEAGAPTPGPDPLFAVGQAVFALSLLEQAAATGTPVGDGETIRTAVDRAMDYTANAYWLGTFTSDFFFFEENWHCLAARASLGHHRHRGYEDFCIDYVRFKTRLILSESSDVDGDLIGGYGFGNVLLPHNTGSAGFGEASSAALELLAARGEGDERIARSLERALAFLLRHQWSDASCFACSSEHPIAGAFSEHMGSMEIRIDYVQHAMAALGHGAQALRKVSDG